MKKSVVCIPIDLDKMESVRLLARALPDADATAIVIRMWIEWAAQGVGWRPLGGVWMGTEYDWARERLSFLIEDFCGWKGARGALMTAAYLADVIRTEKKGEHWGVELCHFAEFNEHILSGTIQHRGGVASAAQKRNRDDRTLAAQQRKIMERTGELQFTGDVRAQEADKAIALIMQLDRIMGSARKSSEYAPVLDSAVRVLRTKTPSEIEACMERALALRESQEIARSAEAALKLLFGA